MNAQWLGDILLGNFEALRQIQCGRYTAFNLQDPFAPTPHLVLNLLGEGSPPRAGSLPASARVSPSSRFLSTPSSLALCPVFVEFVPFFLMDS